MTVLPMRAPCYLASLFCFGVGCAVVVVQPPDASAAPTNASADTLPPLPPPPIAYFRQLLGLRQVDLDKTLAGIAEPIRTNLQAKLREYAALTAGGRGGRPPAPQNQKDLGAPVRKPPTKPGAPHSPLPHAKHKT